MPKIMDLCFCKTKNNSRDDTTGNKIIVFMQYQGCLGLQKFWTLMEVNKLFYKPG